MFDLVEPKSGQIIRGDLIVEDPQYFRVIPNIKQIDRLVLQVDPNIRPLDEAIEDENVEAIKLWIAVGIDVNDADAAGITPLMLASKEFSPECVAELLSQGADPSRVDNNGRTALHHAATMVMIDDSVDDIVKMLVLAGCDGEIRDKNGQTAVDVAKKFGGVDVAAEFREWISSSK